jgi:hypothetical protein
VTLAALLLCSALGASPPAPASYTTRMVDGRQVLVAADGSAEVWLIPMKLSEEIGAYLVFSNLGDEVMKVFPQRVQAEAISTTARGEKRAGLKTYHPAQYESLVRKRNWTTGGLVADTPMPIAGASGNPPRWRPPPRHGEGFSGPNTAGVIIPARPPLETFRNMLSRVPATGSTDIRRLSESLLWPHEIPAHQAYGGLVYIKFKPGDLYRIRVPAGTSQFQFEFNLPLQ